MLVDLCDEPVMRRDMKSGHAGPAATSSRAIGYLDVTGELFTSDLSRRARHADGRDNIVGVVENWGSDASATDLPLLVFDRVARMSDLCHLLFQLADRRDRVFVVSGQTTISNQAQKLVFRQISRKTLANCRAVKFQTLSDPGG
jgi:short subunit dehydrogenase-like uncharacterized protein